MLVGPPADRFCAPLSARQTGCYSGRKTPLASAKNRGVEASRRQATDRNRMRIAALAGFGADLIKHPGQFGRSILQVVGRDVSLASMRRSVRKPKPVRSMS